MRRMISTIIVALSIGVSTLAATPAAAEPPNIMGIPRQIPQAINGILPAPPYPRLHRIPLRAQAKGFDHRLLELREAVLPSPTGDPMFDRWPTDLAAMSPGELIAVRDVFATAAPVVTTPIRSARLLKFRSTDASGTPFFGTATILVPRTPTRGPRPVLPVVAGHVVLDAIRALANLDRKMFGDSRVAMTGYSGGAIATNGAAKLLGSYAPELAPRMVGAALGGVPADFRMLVGSMNANLASGIFHSAVFGIAREHPDMLAMANNFAQWFATSPLKNVCTIPATLTGQTFWPLQLMASDPDPFHSPVAERIYRITRMADRKSQVPLYIYHGTYEWWIPAAGARNLYRGQCALGARAVYREVFGEHVLAILVGYPEALAWLDQRLRGIPAPDECPRRR